MERSRVAIYEYVMEQFERADCPTYPVIAAGSGVPKRTVEKIRRGEIKDPGVSHVEKLANYFQRLETEREAVRS